ncbi:MAG: kinase [Candidatus Omnitrophica bacterium]|nr:kinase [Candidatus Omnitrophota bacterium]
MIISRTPLRISFFGGGTDYPLWYNENGGAVLATTINKYCFITCRHLPPFFEHKSRIVYSHIENVKEISEIRHPSVKSCLEFMKIKQGIEIHHDGDLPARSGLGSSSAFTVGLLHSLYALAGKMPTKRQLALDAIQVEQKMIKENVGSQDQVLAAFGGFNRVEFGGNQHIQVRKITVSQEKLESLQSHMMLFFTGFSRIASEIASEQLKNIPQKKKELKTMHQMVDQATEIMNSGRIDEFGRLLHESWKLKKSLSHKISNPDIDEIYACARKSGATGGKLLGAGGGGFILFFVQPEKQKQLKEKLKKLLWVPFRFEDLGSQIIFYQQT